MMAASETLGDTWNPFHPGRVLQESIISLSTGFY